MKTRCCGRSRPPVAWSVWILCGAVMGWLDISSFDATRRPPAMPILRVASKLLIANQPIAAPHEIHADHAAGGLDRANDLIFMRHEPTLFTTFR